MKSKKSKKSKSSKQDLDRSIQPTPTPKVERKMINRKAVQAEIDKDKKVRALLATGHYNINQIAAMLGLQAERVKRIKDAKTGK
jgi:hypothetical protein